MLKAARPLEYVAFVQFALSTKEGPAYCYMAVDAFTGYVFNLGVSNDDSSQNIIKHIYLLTEDREFSKKAKNGFTLVMEGGNDLQPSIEKIITGMNGKVILNKGYNNYIANPAIESILKFIKNDK